MKNDKSFVEKAMYGIELSKSKGLTGKKKDLVSMKGLYGLDYKKSLSFQLYMKKYFYPEMLLFAVSLDNKDFYDEFNDKSKIENSEQNNILNFLKSEPVKPFVKQFYDGMQDGTKNKRFLAKLVGL